MIYQLYLYHITKNMKHILPQETIFYQLEKAIKLYRKLAQNEINKSGHDISLNQLILLINLTKNPDLSQVELSDYIFKDFASIARMVDILVKKKYLTRTENPNDRRKKDLTPTPKCSKMVIELLPIIDDYRQKAIEDFKDKDLKKLSSLLSLLVENCERNIKK